jgi:hypothetical protein
VRHVAPEQLVEPAPLTAFGRERPGRGEAGCDSCLGLLGEQQPAQTALRIAERGGDGMDAV